MTRRIEPIDYDFDMGELKRSYGISAQWLAPLGLFRFSYAFPLDADDADLSGVWRQYRALPVLDRWCILGSGISVRRRAGNSDIWRRLPLNNSTLMKQEITMLQIRKWAVLVAMTGMLAMPQAVLAQAKPIKVGFVNVARLLAESPQANAANRALENEFAPRQRDLLAKQKAFKDRADKMQKDAAVMGADERRNAENELRRDERELARQLEELREDLNNRKNEELGKLRVNLLGEVESFARQGGYDLIVSDALVRESGHGRHGTGVAGLAESVRCSGAGQALSTGAQSGACRPAGCRGSVHGHDPGSAGGPLRLRAARRS